MNQSFNCEDNGIMANEFRIKNGFRIGSDGQAINEISVDNTLSANADNILPTQSAVKGFVENNTEPDLGNPTSDGQVLSSSTDGTRAWIDMSGGGGSGDVTGPSSSTDTNLSMFSGTSGKVIADSGVRFDDNGTSSSTLWSAVKIVDAIGNSGGGNVIGSGSSTDGHVTIYSGTSGKLIADSGILATDLAMQSDLDSKQDSLGSPSENRQYLTSSTDGSTSWETISHISLTDRDAGGSHPMTAITGLIGAIDLKEDNLGNPGSDGQVLSSDTSGNRLWVDMTATDELVKVDDGDYEGGYLDDKISVGDGITKTIVTDSVIGCPVGEKWEARGIEYTPFSESDFSEPGVWDYQSDGSAIGISGPSPRFTSITLNGNNINIYMSLEVGANPSGSTKTVFLLFDRYLEYIMDVNGSGFSIDGGGSTPLHTEWNNAYIDLEVLYDSQSKIITVNIESSGITEVLTSTVTNESSLYLYQHVNYYGKVIMHLKSIFVYGINNLSNPCEGENPIKKIELSVNSSKIDHGDISGRDAVDQHPIDAITDLRAELDTAMDRVAGATQYNIGVFNGTDGQIIDDGLSVNDSGSDSKSLWSAEKNISELNDKKKGLDKTVSGLTLVTGKFLHIANVNQKTTADIRGIVGSVNYDPGFILNIIHSYDVPKVDFALTHYSRAAGTQFDQLVFTQLTNGAAFKIYLRIASVDSDNSATIGLGATYTVSSPLLSGMSLIGEVVDSINNIDLTVDITSNDFRWTNVAPGEGYLGAPTINGQVLSSNTSGVRTWVNQPNPGGIVDEVVGDTNISVDNSDPAKPKVSVSSTDITDLGLHNLKELGDVDSASGVDGQILTIDSGVWTPKDNNPLWGDINGNINNQSDLTAILDDKQNSVGVPTNNGQYLSGDTSGATIWKNFSHDGLSDRNNGVQHSMSAIDGLQVAIDSKEDSLDYTSASSGQVLTFDGVDSYEWSDKSGVGATTFVGLDDTPTDYSGAANKIVAVNTGGTGLEFIDPSGSSAVWGSITGTIGNQTDLQDELDGKRNAAHLRVDNVTPSIGQWIKLFEVPNISFTSAAVTYSSMNYAPGMKIDIFHTYNEIVYDLGYAQVENKPDPQFSRLIISMNGNGSPAVVWVKVGEFESSANDQPIIMDLLTQKSTDSSQYVLYGEVVDEADVPISDAIADITIVGNKFRASNVPFGDFTTDHVIDLSNVVPGDSNVTDALNMLNDNKVNAPTSTTINNLASFDSANGVLIKDSGVSVDDSGTGTGSIWTASKISTELNSKQDDIGVGIESQVLLTGSDSNVIWDDLGNYGWMNEDAYRGSAKGIVLDSDKLGGKDPSNYASSAALTTHIGNRDVHFEIDDGGTSNDTVWSGYYINNKITTIPGLYMAIADYSDSATNPTGKVRNSDQLDGYHASDFAQVTDLTNHTGDTNNPHGVTLAQVGGTKDHSGLDNLDADDHTQYHNDTRGDARYYQKSEIDTSLDGKMDKVDVGAIPEFIDRLAKIGSDGNVISSGVIIDDAVETDQNIWTATKIRSEISGSGGGDVSGPGSSVDDNLALFNGVTGKIIKDSGVAISDVTGREPALGSPTTDGQFLTSLSDGTRSWADIPGGGIGDVPSAGKTYLREQGNWIESDVFASADYYDKTATDGLLSDKVDTVTAEAGSGLSVDNNDINNLIIKNIGVMKTADFVQGDPSNTDMVDNSLALEGYGASHFATASDLSSHTGDANIHMPVDDNTTGISNLWTSKKISDNFTSVEQNYMLKSVYDADGDNIVDDSRLLDGNPPSYYASDTNLTNHTGDTSNPHSVTAGQVGNNTAQWNANKLNGVDINSTAPVNKQYLYYDGTNWVAHTPVFVIEMSKAITLPDPQPGDAFGMWIPTEDVNITKIRGVVDTGDITANVSIGTSDVADTDWQILPTSNTSDLTLDNTYVLANTPIIFKVPSVTTAAGYVNLTIYYTVG